jgi:hypothetical protein
LSGGLAGAAVQILQLAFDLPDLAMASVEASPVACRNLPTCLEILRGAGGDPGSCALLTLHRRVLLAT